MSLKDKIASILFGSKAEAESAGEDLRAEGLNPESPDPRSEAAASAPEDPALIKLPGEHPLIQLYSQRRREAGAMPAPRLCMDEDGTLPEDMIRREKSRLQSALKTACNFRMKSMKDNGSRSKKDGDAGAAEGPQGADALPWFHISANKLYAWVMVFPPMGEGQELTRAMLYQALQGQGIAYGINERLADRLSHDDQRYFHLFLIAQGKPAFDGKNGNIVDYFPRVVERILAVDEIGRAHV